MMQPRSRFSFRAGALLAGMLACVSVSQAQPGFHWQKMNVPNLVGNCYFYNENYGFLLPVGNGPPNFDTTTWLYRTIDGCQTWDSVQNQTWTDATPGGRSGSASDVEFHFLFLTASHLFLVNGGTGLTIPGHPYVGLGIYESLDSGRRWRRITPDSCSCDCVYANGDTIYASGWDYYDGSYPGSTYTGSLYKRSTDDGKTWTDIFPFPPGRRSPAIVLGNRAGIISVVDGPPTGGTGMTAVSSNGGNTWKLGPQTNPVLAELEQYAWMKPRSSALFTLQWFNTGWPSFKPSVIVWRSTNNGFTFQRSDSIDQAARNIEGIAGSDCAPIYIATGGPHAFIRTTDLGATWQNIDGPYAFNYSGQLSVVGNGAVVYVTDQNDVLWKTTDGGDGALSASDWPNLSVSHFGDIRDTLTTKLCDSTSFSFALSSSACLRYFLDSVLVDSIGPNRCYSVLHNRYIGDGQPSDTALITIVPKKPGTYPLTVHGRLRREDWLEIDTTFHLTLIIQPNPGMLDLAAKPLYDFGVQSLCKPHVVWDTFSVSAHGCEQVQVDSIVFQPINGSGFTFKKVKSFIAPATGTVAIHFPISYKPTQAETDSGMIVIYWESPEGAAVGAHHADTLWLRGAAVADSRSFVIASDTLSTRMCDSATASVILQNPTCNQMEIDSISLPAGLTLLTSLPVLLDTASEKTLSIRVAPGAGTAPLHLGDTVLPVRLHVVGTSSFDTTVMLHVRVGRGVPAASISVAALNFDTVSTCSEKTLAVVILSNGCDTLTCSGAVSAPPFRVVGAHRGALSVGASDTVLITFASQTPGTFFDTLVITTSAGTETVPLQGYALSDVAALGGGSLALPQVMATCGGDTANIPLPNLSCKNIVIDSVAGICAPFQILSGIGDTIPSSGSGRLIVTYLPRVAGTDECTMRVHYHGADGIPHDTTYTLSASAIAPPVLALHLRSGAVSAPPGNHVAIPVYASSSQPISVGSVRFRLNMRTDLLTPVRVTTIAGGAGTAPLQVDAMGANFAIRLPDGFALAADTLLATVECAVFVTDTMQTQITLTQPSISANTTCLSMDSTSPAITFDLLPLCGDSVFMRAMQSRLFEIESIRPNPASGQLEVRVVGADSGALSIRMYDALGRAAIPVQNVRSTSLRDAVTLDVSSLPEGIYYLRISCGGFVQTRSISIQR